MDPTKQRLERDLHAAMARLRHLGGAVALGELPRPVGVNSPLADEVDEIQASQQREIGGVTRDLLVERVNRLLAALDRLNDGEYGFCVECGGAISPARLLAMPEVQTCVGCQDRIEGGRRQLGWKTMALSHVDEATAFR